MKGFTLFEVLIVLGIMGAILSTTLPNLALTGRSQMGMALRDFSATARATYDAAVLQGRMHRLVLEMRTGEYWSEAAPMGYRGRPPASSPETARLQEAFNRTLEELDQSVQEPRKADDGQRTYGFSSIMQVRRDVLRPVTWTEPSDPVLAKRSLPGTVAFAQVASVLMPEPLTFSKAEPKETAVIYFFPSGECTQTSVHFGLLKSPTEMGDSEVKFTLLLDPISGRSEILEGFQDADFTKNAAG